MYRDNQPTTTTTTAGTKQKIQLDAHPVPVLVECLGSAVQVQGLSVAILDGVRAYVVREKGICVCGGGSHCWDLDHVL